MDYSPDLSSLKNQNHNGNDEQPNTGGEIDCQ